MLTVLTLYSPAPNGSTTHVVFPSAEAPTEAAGIAALSWILYPRPVSQTGFGQTVFEKLHMRRTARQVPCYRGFLHHPISPTGFCSRPFSMPTAGPETFLFSFFTFISTKKRDAEASRCQHHISIAAQPQPKFFFFLFYLFSLFISLIPRPPALGPRPFFRLTAHSTRTCRP